MSRCFGNEKDDSRRHPSRASFSGAVDAGSSPRKIGNMRRRSESSLLALADPTAI